MIIHGILITRHKNRKKTVALSLIVWHVVFLLFKRWIKKRVDLFYKIWYDSILVAEKAMKHLLFENWTKQQVCKAESLSSDKANFNKENPVFFIEELLKLASWV